MEVPPMINDALDDLQVLINKEIDIELGYFPFESLDLLEHIMIAAEVEQKQLNAQGRSYVTMTMADWRSHLQTIVPSLLDYLKMRYWNLLYMLLLRDVWKNNPLWEEEVLDFDTMSKQFKLYAKELVTKSRCCIYLVYDIGTQTEDDFNLPLLMSHAAQVMVIQKIIESSTKYDLIETMVGGVLSEMDCCCEKYLEKHRGYYGGLKRKWSTSDVGGDNN